MREIKYITLHCTAGPQTQSVQTILNYWKRELGWDKPGYHFMIEPSGKVNNLLPIDTPSNGVAGFNANNIHISYIGGVKVIPGKDSKGRPINALGSPIDNRTTGQIVSMIKLIEQFSIEFPDAIILGHRDFSPDKDRNGIIEPSEWMKTCPSFSVKEWLSEIGFKSKAKKVYLETTTGVNIRSGAGVLFPKISPPLAKSTRVQRIGEASEWTYVQVIGTGLLGWISSQYLKEL